MAGEIKRNYIYEGHVIDILSSFPAGCISTVMTSPPYWALRDYGNCENVWDDPGNCDHEWDTVDELRKPSPGDIPAEGSILANSNRTNTELRPGKPSAFCTKCGAWRGNLGLEPTPELFVKHLCDVFDEIRRVLRDDGTIWVNLGDSYASNSTKSNWDTFDQYRMDGGQGKRDIGRNERKEPKDYGDIKQKSLVMIPQRFAIEMINRGWILRNVIIWHKPNPMPSSATDRFTVDFEYLYFFSKKKKYYFEQQFEPLKSSIQDNLSAISYERKTGTFGSALKNKDVILGNGKIGKRYSHKQTDEEIAAKLSLGRNKRAVWTIPTRSYKGAHFATYPPKLCETPIKAGCPRYICSKCGKPRELIIDTEGRLGKSGHDHSADLTQGAGQGGRERSNNYTSGNYKRVSRGYTRCACNAPYQPGIVLDPFIGSGTTGYVARKLGRDFVGIDMNPEYIKLAWKRIKPVMNRRMEEFA